MIQRYIINKPSATVTVDGAVEGQAIAVEWCKSEDVAELEANHAELEAKYKKLGEYCYQLYNAAGDLTRLYIEIEPEELKEQAKQVLRNFEKDPIFWEIIA
jgi:hypothetical protein